jgi:hypothetical protein
MIGTAAGLATSAKWTGLFVLPVMGAAAIMSSWRQRSPRRVIWMTLVGAVGALAAFFVTNPYFLEMRDPYVKEFQLTMAIQRAGQIGRVQNGPLDYLLSRTPTWETPWVGTSLLSDLGLPGFLLATGGIALAATGRLGFAGGFYAATVLGYLLIVSGSGSVKAIRYLLPVFPFLWAFSGGAAERLLPPRARARRNPALWLAVVVAVVAVPAYHSLEYAVALRQPSTNALVREWMRQNVPKGSVVFLGPFFTNDFRQLPFRFRRLGGAGARQFGFPPEVGPNPERDPLYGPELVDKFRRAGVEYVVLNSYFDGALSRIPENERFFPRSVESYEAFLARLSAEADLVHVRKGWSEHRIGPDIWIWRLRAATGS